MEKRKKRVSLLLSKIGIKFLIITLFSVLLITPMIVESANFKYSKFNWEKFAEANQEYWSGYCNNALEKEKCQDEILSAQKKFYVKFYKILAKFEKKGLYINDNIILETVFYDMNPSSFADDANEYKEDWNSQNGVYNIDEADLDDPDIEVNYKDESAAEYYAEEKDTLKTLIQNMIAYSTTCYGVYGDPTIHEAEDGSKYSTCDAGGTKQSLATGFNRTETKCVDKLTNNELGFFQYYTSKWAHDKKLLLNKIVPFLGIVPVDPYYNECMTLGSSYPEGANYSYNDDPHVSTDRYFDFLSYNRYFDKKAHLQENFKETILDPAGVDCMTSSVCTNSLEASGEYEKYEGEAILVRREIIYDILDILENYGLEISYSAYQNAGYINANNEAAVRKSFFWPIGSDDTEERNGIIYADGEPASTTVESYFGPRTNAITNQEQMHYGIDITGEKGKTNVIAVYQGEVISAYNSCSTGNYDCNDGLGNTIILSHNNGDYTVYAHLNDITVSVGDSVQQGQVIGHVGTTGRTLTSNLHFELRSGGNDISFAVDPLNTISSDNARPQPSQGDFSVHQTSLTREEFISRMHNYCNTTKCNSTMQNVFVAHAGEVYDASIANNVNPELVVVRAKAEGFSPGGSTNNYWGIRCYNGAGAGACSNYSSLSDGIKGFADVVKNYNTVSEMMSKNYAYIGAYWYNPGSWSLGGCKYYSYIQEYMSSSRAAEVANICSGPPCDKSGGGSCTKTTAEDQLAYATWQVNKKMAPERYNIFGL